MGQPTCKQPTTAPYSPPRFSVRDATRLLVYVCVCARLQVVGGGVTLYGATEREVGSQMEMAAVLETGTLCRSTASTNMNNKCVGGALV